MENKRAPEAMPSNDTDERNNPHSANLDKPVSIRDSSSSDPDDDETSSTEDVLSDSLSELRSMHESSFARNSILDLNTTIDDDSSSSSCSSSTLEDAATDHSLSMILTPPEKLRLDVPLHRVSHHWQRSGHDSLSFLRTIESEEEFSDDCLSMGEEDDRNAAHEEQNLEALCSQNSKRTKLLGEGAFGQVWLVLHRHKAYALKVCSKYDLITEGAVQQVLRERQILGQLHHPFICELVASNQDDHFLYMLQEYCAGGELFSLLERQGGKLRESSARFYMSCIADALEYLHENRIVYRDCKPENIMLDQFGYPQLIDFGCAKQFDEDQENNHYLSRTLCGTPRFVSPEMIEPERYGGGHSFPADYWALGILLYEMLMGNNPYEFDGMSEMDVYESIVDESFTPSLSDDVSPAVQELVGKLLAHDPQRRLGSAGESRVLQHRWFADVDLATLRNRPEHAAPWSPDLSDASDTHYFDDWENVLESKFSQSHPTLTISQRNLFVNF